MATETHRPSDRARALVAGAYDLHVHIGPDVPARRIDDVSLARRCGELGLAGFALKSHYTSEIAAREGARIVWMPTVDSPAETASRSRATRCRSGRGSNTSCAGSGSASRRSR